MIDLSHECISIAFCGLCVQTPRIGPRFCSKAWKKSEIAEHISRCRFPSLLTGQDSRIHEEITRTLISDLSRSSRKRELPCWLEVTDWRDEVLDPRLLLLHRLHCSDYTLQNLMNKNHLYTRRLILENYSAHKGASTNHRKYVLIPTHRGWYELNGSEKSFFS